MSTETLECVSGFFMTNDFFQKKQLGQHFLKDKNIIRKIVKIAEIEPNEKVWEIGPGLGILTDELLQTGCNLTCFEIDQSLYPILKEKFGEQITLIENDVLQENWQDLLQADSVKLVANLPYQITTPLLFKILDYRSHFSRIVIMIQKEVAERLQAKPNCKAYGVLSLKIQFYFDVNYEFTVKPHLFFPPPNVDSAVISLVPREKIPPIEDEKNFWKMVKASFANRRKMLRNNLNVILSKDKMDFLLTNYPELMQKRAEALSESDFIRLWEVIRKE
jgi:16S rRNA (adenine1518-N6/adenine1519-N6)-dimethyltransferase